MAKSINFKILRIMFVITIIIITAISGKVVAASKIKLGDINHDGKIDQTDLLKITRHIAAVNNNKNTNWILNGNEFKLADVNENGKIDSGDMLVILRYIAADKSKEIGKKHPSWLKAKEIEIDIIPTPEPNPSIIEATEVKLDKTKLELDMSGIKTAILKAKIEPEIATYKTLVYSTSNDKVVSVDNTGKITAKADGTAIITVAAHNGKKATCNVKVKTSPTKITLTKTKLELDMSGTKTAILKAKIEPEIATDKTIKFTTSNEKIVSVDNTGKITAKANGTATITAETINGKKATCNVKVKTNPTKITMNKTENTIDVDSVQYLVTTIGPNNTAEKNIEWTNYNQDIVAVEKPVLDGTYYIKSVINENKILEVANGSKDNNAPIQLNDRDETKKQQFEITSAGDEYYTIKSVETGKMMDVPMGSQTIGTKVQQFEANGTDSQKWEFEYAGEGKYYIKAKVNRLYLDVQDRKAENGVQLRLWEENRTVAETFIVELIKKKTPTIQTGTYYIKPIADESKVLEVENSSNENNAKVQLEPKAKERKENQQFELIRLENGNFLVIAKHSGKMLDVDYGRSIPGTKVQQFEFNGTDAQIWKLEPAGDGYYYFKARCNGMYLDVKNGIATDGLQLQVWDGNKSNAQKFKIEKVNNNTKHSIYNAVMIKGKNAGKATITAKTANGKKATTKVTGVRLIKSIKFDNSVEVENGNSITLTPRIEPENATNKKLTWESTNTNVATVDKNGKVKAKSEGTTTIVVKSDNEITASCTVKVISPNITGGQAIAEAAVRLACRASPEDNLFSEWSNSRIYDDRTREYVDAKDRYIGANVTEWDGGGYASCATAVAVIARYTQVDLVFEFNTIPNIWTYLRSSSNWMDVGNPDFGSYSNLQPGDVLINSHHILIYVGNQTVRRKYPNSNADMYEASFSDYRYGSFYPMLNPFAGKRTDNTYTIFRHVNWDKKLYRKIL